MNVVIRADASTQIGTGHVMRCLTLANQLAANGAEVRFMCRAHAGHLISYIEESGFAVERLPSGSHSVANSPGPVSGWLGVPWEQDAQETLLALIRLSAPCDWLIVDHYCLDARWEKAVRHRVEHLMVIDDLANRRHDCDLLLDTGLYSDGGTRYRNLVGESCRVLIGPSYALLRREFRERDREIRIRDGTIRRLLVSFGGADSTGETAKVLAALGDQGLRDLEVDVVVGGANPHLDDLRQRAASLPNVVVHVDTREMAGLMARADLAIGGGGTTTWERLYLGLPSMVIVQAENQIQQTESLVRHGCLLNLGWHHAVSAERIRAELVKLRREPGRVGFMAEQSLALPVGELGAEEVSEKLMEYTHVGT